MRMMICSAEKPETAGRWIAALIVASPPLSLELYSCVIGCLWAWLEGMLKLSNDLAKGSISFVDGVGETR